MTTATQQRIETTVNRATPIVPSLPPGSTPEMEAEHQRLTAECEAIAAGRKEVRDLREKVLAGIEENVLEWSGDHIAHDLRVSEFDLLKREIRTRQDIAKLFPQIEAVMRANAAAASEALAKLEERIVSTMKKLGWPEDSMLAMYKLPLRVFNHDFSGFASRNTEWKRITGETIPDFEPHKRREAENNVAINAGLGIAKKMTVLVSGLG